MSAHLIGVGIDASEAPRGHISPLDCGAVKTRHASGGAAVKGGNTSRARARAKRDARIFELHEFGCRARQIAAVYQIKPNRVWQIIKAHREARPR